MSDAVQDSDALYYPYINIRDEAWLKTTLLYFPHVVRMVPPNYRTNANGFMRTLTQTRGARNEPLLGSYSLRSYAADDAVDRLTDRLLDDARQDPNFARRFSRAATREAYGQDAESFQIHRGKAPQVFWDELKKLGMMWPPPTRVRGSDRDEWAALHPLLGEAFMATVAIAAAKERGMEIVTDAPGVHRATACRDEEAIYQMLIRRRPEKRHILRRLQDDLTGQKEQLDNPKGEMTLRLAHLIVVGNFDVSALTAGDLAEMSKNREALFDFRRDLGRRVAEIPAMSSESERERRLQAAANDAIAEWRKSLPEMSKFARRFFGLGLLDKSEKTMTDFAKALIPGSLTAAGSAVVAAKAGSIAALVGPPLIAAAPGLAVAAAVYGVKTWRGLKEQEMSGPLRYLSLLNKRGATLLLAARPTLDTDLSAA